MENERRRCSASWTQKGRPENCDRDPYGDGLCVAHYRRAVRLREGRKAPPVNAPISPRAQQRQGETLVQVTTRVPLRVQKALVKAAKKRAVKTYQLMAELLEVFAARAA